MTGRTAYGNDLLFIEVRGDPAPKGSKRPFRNKHTGKIMQVESSKRVDPWRQDVRQAVENAVPGHWFTRGPVGVGITFAYDRPASHYRTGRNAHLLREGAPTYPLGRKDDVDKLARAVLDAIESTGLAYHDDGQVVHLEAFKAYTDHSLAPDRPGATIRLWKVGRNG